MGGTRSDFLIKGSMAKRLFLVRYPSLEIPVGPCFSSGSRAQPQALEIAARRVVTLYLPILCCDLFYRVSNSLFVIFFFLMKTLISIALSWSTLTSTVRFRV